MTDQQSRSGLFQLTARHPEVLRRLKATGSFANRETNIADRDRELMILRMAWRYNSEFEWGQHYNKAIEAGLTADEIAALQVDVIEPQWSAADRAVLEAIDGLVSDCMIPESAWTVLRQRYDEDTMLEFVIFFGHYVLVATFANTFGLSVAEGRPGFDGPPKTQD